MLCRDRCGYCTFAKPPARLDHAYLPIEDVLAIARAGAALGCHEALFTLGEGPEDRYPVAAEWLAAHGYSTTIDYLEAACRAVLEETGLLPHANAGALSQADLERLRAVSPSQGMMLESLADRLHEPGGPHHGAPDKTASRRLETLEAAGRARIPFTTGILVGFGETPRNASTRCSRSASHERHGHVQEVIVQNFLPKPGTKMHDAAVSAGGAACIRSRWRVSCSAARCVQAPPNLTDADGLGDLIAAGIDDWGGVSPLTADHVNPERPWPALELLRGATEAAGKTLAPPDSPSTRSTSATRRSGSTRRCGSRSCARTTSKVSPATTTGRAVVTAPAARPSVRTGHSGGPVSFCSVLGRRPRGKRSGSTAGDLLARQAPDMSCGLRWRTAPARSSATWSRSSGTRNINYTNICTFKCRFCASPKGPLSLNLRGIPTCSRRRGDPGPRRQAVGETTGCACLQGAASIRTSTASTTWTSPGP